MQANTPEGFLNRFIPSALFHGLSALKVRQQRRRRIANTPEGFLNPHRGIGIEARKKERNRKRGVASLVSMVVSHPFSSSFPFFPVVIANRFDPCCDPESLQPMIRFQIAFGSMTCFQITSAPDSFSNRCHPSCTLESVCHCASKERGQRRQRRQRWQRRQFQGQKGQ